MPKPNDLAARLKPSGPNRVRRTRPVRLAGEETEPVRRGLRGHFHNSILGNIAKVHQGTFP